MDKVKCPRCREPLEESIHDVNCGCQVVGAECQACGWTSPGGVSGRCGDPHHDTIVATLLGACAPLAYFEPRERLPTPEEEAAHRARHGEGAGWFIRFRFIGRLEWSEWADCRQVEGSPIPALIRSAGFEAYPHINGRPVAWPEEAAR